MKNYVLFFTFLFILGFARKSKEPKVFKILNQFKTPESIEVSPHGIYFVSNIGEFNVNGDGKISKIENDSVTTFAENLNDPKGLSYRNNYLYAADCKQIWKIDMNGNKTIFVDSTDFPEIPNFLNDLAFDKDGNLYVSDSGDLEKEDGAIYKIIPNKSISKVINYKDSKEIFSPNGLIFDKNENLLVVDFKTGKLLKINQAKKSVEVLNQVVKAGDGLAYDSKGFLYVSDFERGKIFKINNENHSEEILTGLNSPADITIDKSKDLLLIPELEISKVKIANLY